MGFGIAMTSGLIMNGVASVAIGCLARLLAAMVEDRRPCARRRQPDGRAGPVRSRVRPVALEQCHRLARRPLLHVDRRTPAVPLLVLPEPTGEIGEQLEAARRCRHVHGHAVVGRRNLRGDRRPGDRAQHRHRHEPAHTSSPHLVTSSVPSSEHVERNVAPRARKGDGGAGGVAWPGGKVDVAEPSGGDGAATPWRAAGRRAAPRRSGRPRSRGERLRDVLPSSMPNLSNRRPRCCLTAASVTNIAAAISATEAGGVERVLREKRPTELDQDLVLTGRELGRVGDAVRRGLAPRRADRGTRVACARAAPRRRRAARARRTSGRPLTRVPLVEPRSFSPQRSPTRSSIGVEAGHRGVVSDLHVVVGARTDRDSIPFEGHGLVPTRVPDLEYRHRIPADLFARRVLTFGSGRVMPRLDLRAG